MDGSRFSQCSLDQVRAVALVPSAPEILILRVVEPLPDDVRNGLVELGGEQITRLEEKRKAEALDYVKSMVKTLKQQGLQVKSDVVFGRPAEEIMNYADKNKFDLIIMSTHGRSEITTADGKRC
jgi:nucleotide-binding universal stress UspA family protein